MSNDLFGVVAIVLVVAIGAVAFGPAFVAGSDRVGASESLTVDYASNVSVSESGLRYADSVTITNSSGGELERGTDYVWLVEKGAVDFKNTSATTSGESVEIAYQYREADDRQRTTAAIVETLHLPLVLVLFLLAGGYIFRELV
jgi:hypothetical protein